SLPGTFLKTVSGVPVALLRSGLSGLRAVAMMFMNPLAALRGGLAAAGAVLRVLASGPLAMLRVALYAISGLLGALLSPIGLVVTALAGVALVVWKYWQPITAFLAGVVEGFKAAAGPISAAFEPLKPVFQWIGDKVQAPVSYKTLKPPTIHSVVKFVGGGSFKKKKKNMISCHDKLYDYI
ncbi:hypothetical protein I8R61_34030, partial [Pseudomonas aeruginosa]|nr:hypothetical protein [Pseudomonas aeruginosa]